jgi:tetratricopeptide (TPR) repeat protein
MQDPEKALENVQMALTMAKKDAIDGALLAQIRRDPSFRGLFADRAIRRALGVTPAPIEVAVNTPAGRPSDLKDAVADRPALAQDPAVVSKLAQGDEEFSARRYATALAAYRTALSLNSARASLTPDAVASLNARIGESYNRLGQSERAIAALNDSLRLNTMNPEARYQLALALAASGRSSSSIDMLRQAFAACVGHADLRRLMIRAKTDAEFEGARALPAFADALDSASSR